MGTSAARKAAVTRKRRAARALHEGARRPYLRQAAARRKGKSQADADHSGRRCALTRAPRPKDELIRFVLAPDGTVVKRLFGVVTRESLEADLALFD